MIFTASSVSCIWRLRVGYPCILIRMIIESYGVGRCSKVRFNFDHVHLSELMAEARSGVKTPRFFEWSKLILFDFNSINRCDTNRGLFGRRPVWS